MRMLINRRVFGINLSESDDEPIILEPIDSGESGVIMAQPLVNVAPSTAIMASLSLIGAPSSSAITASSSENEASTSSRKRKQSSITDFFCKKIPPIKIY